MPWSDIRNAMKTTLEATGIPIYDVMPAALSDNDVAVVLPGDPLIEPTGHGELDQVYIRVAVRSKRGAVADGQRALDALIGATGAKSIRAAVDADRTLGGAVSAAQFQRVHAYGAVEGQEGAFQADIDFLALVVDA